MKTRNYHLTGRRCENCNVPLSRETEKRKDGEWRCSLC